VQACYVVNGRNCLAVRDDDKVAIYYVRAPLPGHLVTVTGSKDGVTWYERLVRNDFTVPPLSLETASIRRR
jgi:hypothetical protein